jgi:urease accessory protein
MATPCPAEVLEPIRELCEQTQQGTAGTTLLREVLIVRYLGNSTAEAHQLFRAVWSIIRPIIMNKPALAPRIWST